MKTIVRVLERGTGAALLVLVIAAVPALFPNRGQAGEAASVDKPAPKKPAAKADTKSVRKDVKLPGLVVSFRRRSVDIEATVCLAQGTLELIACTKGSKEHESIVTIEARPVFIHTALLLLGAEAGHPAMRKPVDEKKERWVNLPPRGDPVDVYLVVRNQAGNEVERPIGDFITRSENQYGAEEGAGEGDAADAPAFPHTFLFAGSHLVGDGPGPRKYLCEVSGNVISIATFGDELLCLPGRFSHDNGSLLWAVDATHLPEVGSKVTLRLVPQVPKEGKAQRDD